MKNKILYFLLLLMLSARINGQVQDTVFVYDKIVVYDTVKIYDTIKVEDRNFIDSEGSDNFFKNNNTTQNAVLAIDTATSKAQLFLFNKNDTATISINSIILSENLKNLENMKKEILTLAAAALLTQSDFAQESKTSAAINEEKIPSFTVGIGVVLANNTQANGNVQGFNLKANKILSEKIIVGLSTDIGRMYQKGHNTGVSEGAVQYDNLSGTYANFFATAACYFLGSAAKSKAGGYGKFGLGTVWYRTHQTYTFIGYPEVWTSEYISSNFSAQLCVGGDVKLGKGKLFAEIVSIPSLFASISYKGSVSDSSVINYPDHWKRNENISDNNFSQQLGFRLGYVINF